MCRSMVHIQSVAAEIRQGNKKRKIETTGCKCIWPALLHRVAINNVHSYHPENHHWSDVANWKGGAPASVPCCKVQDVHRFA